MATGDKERGERRIIRDYKGTEKIMSEKDKERKKQSKCQHTQRKSNKTCEWKWPQN